MKKYDPNPLPVAEFQKKIEGWREERKLRALNKIYDEIYAAGRAYLSSCHITIPAGIEEEVVGRLRQAGYTVEATEPKGHYTVRGW